MTLNRKSIMLWCTFFLNASMSLAAAGGGMEGGGGKGVVCRNPTTQAVEKVELLDLWEAKNLYGRTITASDGAVGTQLSNAFENLRYAVYEGSFAPTNPEFQKLFFQIANQFENPNPETHWLTGTTLTLTPDSYEAAKPNGCGIEQIVTYTDGAVPNVLINKDLWDQMSQTNQAALIAHESFYAYLRSKGEADSMRVRRTIGYIFSGNKFAPISSVIPSEETTCGTLYGSVDPALNSTIFMFKDFQGKTALVPYALFSQIMIGFFLPPEENRTALDLLDLMKFDPSCSPAHSEKPAANGLTNAILPTEIVDWGPADLSAKALVIFACQGKKRVPYILPADADVVLAQTVPKSAHKLTCYPSMQ